MNKVHFYFLTSVSEKRRCSLFTMYFTILQVNNTAFHVIVDLCYWPEPMLCLSVNNERIKIKLRHWHTPICWIQIWHHLIKHIIEWKKYCTICEKTLSIRIISEKHVPRLTFFYLTCFQKSVRPEAKSRMSAIWRGKCVFIVFIFDEPQLQTGCADLVATTCRLLIQISVFFLLICLHKLFRLTQRWKYEDRLSDTPTYW